MKKNLLIVTLVVILMAVFASCEKPIDKKDVPVSGITLNKETITLTAGKTETLIATVLPENAGNKNVTWTSTNSFVATVMPNGLVTALTEGTATIVVTTQDGAKSASCVVKVTRAMSSVRFKKEVEDEYFVTKMRLVIYTEQWENPEYYFGKGIGISNYFEIPPGAHRPQHFSTFQDTKSGDWDDCFTNPSSYNFQAGRKYTIVCKSVSAVPFSFSISDEGEM